ncbi:MAG: cation diffusion facilitator family transporter [Acidobacteriota bacterium]
MNGRNRENLRIGRRVTMISIVASCLLAAANLWVGYESGSTSVIAAGFEFLGDVLASVLVLVGMTLAAKPPDLDHPYGHGRIEILAGLSVGAILALGGLGICYRSLMQVSSVHVAPATYAVLPLLGAIVIRSLMGLWKFRVARAIGSGSLMAEGWNDTADVVSAMAALGGLGLTLYSPARFLAADHYGGLIVGIFVVMAGLRVLRETSLDLIDTMPAEELIVRIRSISMEVPGVLGVEKCFARKTGLQYHVELHVEVAPEISVAASHEIAGEVRTHIRQVLPEIADVLVHVEPFGME